MSAVRTAVSFTIVAAGLSERAVTNMDTTNPQSVEAQRKHDQRALELGQLATKIFDLCPYEHLQLIANGEITD